MTVLDAVVARMTTASDRIEAGQERGDKGIPQPREGRRTPTHPRPGRGFPGPHPGDRGRPVTERPPIVEAMDLAPHPEGGWFRQTWVSPSHGDAAGTTGCARPRRSSTSCCRPVRFGLAPGLVRRALDLRGHGEVTLELGGDGGQPGQGSITVLLGTDMEAGARPQVLVPPGSGSARCRPSGEALVSCLVSPGFRFRRLRAGLRVSRRSTGQRGRCGTSHRSRASPREPGIPEAADMRPRAVLDRSRRPCPSAAGHRTVRARRSTSGSRAETSGTCWRQVKWSATQSSEWLGLSHRSSAAIVRISLTGTGAVGCAERDRVRPRWASRA